MTADTIHITAHITATEPAERATEQAASSVSAGHSAPPLSPGQPAVDLAHLARMTLGEKGLESEVLDLRPSKSRGDRGIVRVRNTTLNQEGLPVMVQVVTMIVPRRPA